MTQFALGTVVGSDGNGIESIEKTDTSGLVDTYTITFTDGSTTTFDVTNGSDGSEVSITQILSSGTKLATITIDGTSTDLYCNSGGSADIVTSWESTPSDTKVASEKLTKDSLDDKISKSNTSGLVKNDGTIDTTSYISDISGKADKTGGAGQITDTNAHSNLGTSAGATQAQINTAIDTMIGQAISYIQM